MYLLYTNARWGYSQNSEVYCGKGREESSIISLMSIFLSDYFGKYFIVYVSEYYILQVVLDYLWDKKLWELTCIIEKAYPKM